MTDKQEMIEKLNELPARYDTDRELAKDTAKFSREMRQRNCCIRLSRPRRVIVAIVIGIALLAFTGLSLGVHFACHARTAEDTSQETVCVRIL